MSCSENEIDLLAVNTIRMLAADAVQQAKSGHPGMPLGAASMAYVLWNRFLRFSPANPRWPNRDRFILSAGHGSALLYALLHLSGYDISLEEIQRFRQWGSKTPGHPEYNLDLGVECTTGPLGQGFGMGVGMATAERFLADRYNRPGYEIMDHFTYAIVSDGDLMEGVASEAASLAGHLGLGKIVYFYDDNRISIEGSTSLTFTEDVGKRFQAYGWHVLRVADGNDLVTIEAAIKEARAEQKRPSLIMVSTHIGFGSPKQDSASSHGEPLGEEALLATKQNLGWPQDKRFHVPESVKTKFQDASARGNRLAAQWSALFEQYRGSYGDAATEFETVWTGGLPAGWDEEIPQFQSNQAPIATRSASGKILNGISKRVPNLLGGSGDLAPSTKTIIAESPDQSIDEPGGRNLRFGVREHAMGAIVNGMALHGGIIPYAATFLIFSDYMKPSLRLAALQGLHTIYVFTHDSLAVGEDGPTHQPVEQLAALRSIPNFTVIRPADANETAAAWKIAMNAHNPTALILTRQDLPILEETCHGCAEQLERGAYVLARSEGKPDIILMASGSEVKLALEARAELAAAHGIKATVVSMPSWELFENQPPEYRESIIPGSVKARLSIEAGSAMGWRRWTGDHGDNVSVDRFGASAPGSEVLIRYGFTVENVVSRAVALVASNK
ncbi:MAG: transketolase [Thermodesulfobacteriota bacterium]|nr:transketolase [Thermodesulfobacteriota bacterium]